MGKEEVLVFIVRGATPRWWSDKVSNPITIIFLVKYSFPKNKSNILMSYYLRVIPDKNNYSLLIVKEFELYLNLFIYLSEFYKVNVTVHTCSFGSAN